MEENLRTISFFGTVDAGSEKTLVSERISSPYKVREISAHFSLNQEQLVQLSFFVSSDKSAPTTGKPNGFNILAEYGQVDFIVGDDDTKTLNTNVRSQTNPSWIKVYANNSDAYDHIIDAQVTIDAQERKP